MRRAIAVIVALSLLIAGAVWAQSPPSSQQKQGDRFREIDFFFLVSDGDVGTIDTWRKPERRARWATVTWLGGTTTTDLWIYVVSGCISDTNKRDSVQVSTVARSYTFGGCYAQIDSIGLNSSATSGLNYAMSVSWSD